MTEVCRRPMMRALLLTCGLFVVTPRWGLAQENKPSKEEAAKFFVDEVKPILIAKCAKLSLSHPKLSLSLPGLSLSLPGLSLSHPRLSMSPPGLSLCYPALTS